jgi:glutamine synthetase
MPIIAEYIWIDGSQPMPELRSKTRVIFDSSLPPSTEVKNVDDIDLSQFPEWGADGSSTQQAEGGDSDIILKPVHAVRDPFRPGGYLVLTEVFTGAGNVHSTNKRAEVRRVLDAGADKYDAWFGFEQEYTLFKIEGRPAGFPINGYPGPQGPYYCSVGSLNIAGRALYEDFLEAAVEAGLIISGVNWEVMPGQAEFQIGPGSGLKASDHIWLGRWLMHRASEKYNLVVSLAAKPAKGDWNGAGMHTNFSTAAMRVPGGRAHIEAACEAIGEKIEEHLEVYGDGYEERLTGHHETCAYNEFRWGIADRTASIRVPRAVGEVGYGYLEDRRPNANADPYRIAARMLQTVCGID